MATQTKNFEQPNISNEIWNDDQLGRAEEALFLKSFLVNRISELHKAGKPASYVLNIDAQWGQGKSFFLARFAKLLRSEGFLVAEVNSWQDDHADDPLLSVMDAIDSAVEPLVKKQQTAKERWQKAQRAGAAVAVAAVKGAVLQGAKKAIGSGVEEISEILGRTESVKTSDDVAKDFTKSIGDAIDKEGQALLERFRQGKRTINSFRKSLTEFLTIAEQKGQKLPLFIFVDELDRCRPPFAIAMLERIKHLFDLDQVVFVVATDTGQLKHSVGAVYGSGFNSEGYLSRFFNRTYHFAKVSRANFIEDLLKRLPIDPDRVSLPPRAEIAHFLTSAFNFFDLPLRDVEQVYDIIRTFITGWDSRVRVELVPLLPIAILHQQRIDLPLNQFPSRFKETASKLVASGSTWKITFPGSLRNPENSVHFISLVNDFIGHTEKALRDMNRDVTAVHSQWVVGRLSDEFAILHGNVSHPGRAGPMSIIRRYPEMVRSAGRLLPNSAD